MTLRITLEVNSNTINIIKVFNRGPVEGYDPGDGPGGGGVRLYEWASLRKEEGSNDTPRGTVLHARDDGAEALAAKVLAQHPNIYKESRSWSPGPK